jgi:hypothetical protein
VVGLAVAHPLVVADSLAEDSPPVDGPGVNRLALNSPAVDMLAVSDLVVDRMATHKILAPTPAQRGSRGDSDSAPDIP